MAKTYWSNIYAAEVDSAKSKNVQQSKQTVGSETKKTNGPLPGGFLDNQKTDSSNTKTTSEPKQSQPQTTTGSETKSVVKGALPTGFFDNKEADLLARGIKLVKPDIKLVFLLLLLLFHMKKNQIETSHFLTFST